MTLIVGLNLSDRLYIAADTRLTAKDKSYTDNIVKVVLLSGQMDILPEIENSNTLCMVVAGHLGFATFLYKEIKKSISEKLLPTDVRELQLIIVGYIKEKTNEWLKSNHYASCVMIFAGMHCEREKVIDTGRFNKLKQVYEKNLPSVDKLQEIEEALEQAPFFKKLAAQAPEELERFLGRSTDIGMNSKIEDAIKTGRPTIAAPDSLIFSVKISSHSLEIEKAEWGEFLAYGSRGITKKDLAEDLLAKMELNPGQRGNEDDLLETELIRSEILGIAKRENLVGIGGIVTPVIIRDNEYQQRFGYRKTSSAGEILEEVFETNEGSFF